MQRDHKLELSSPRELLGWLPVQWDQRLLVQALLCLFLVQTPLVSCNSLNLVRSVGMPPLCQELCEEELNTCSCTWRRTAARRMSPSLDERTTSDGRRSFTPSVLSYAPRASHRWTNGLLAPMRC